MGEIRNATHADAGAICHVYNHYITGTVISFEEAPVSIEDMQGRIAATRSANLPWLVYDEQRTVVGYAYASKWHSRSAYRYTLESSVYVSHDRIGLGIGSRLYAELIRRLRDLNYHTVIGGIALPNAASVALHEKFGFTKVAHYKETGYKFGEWIDVGYWELIL
jgi:phosphinothricin acetyltransferase